jgi:hypothetical protein
MRVFEAARGFNAGTVGDSGRLSRLGSLYFKAAIAAGRARPNPTAWRVFSVRIRLERSKRCNGVLLSVRGLLAGQAGCPQAPHREADHGPRPGGRRREGHPGL